MSDTSITYLRHADADRAVADIDRPLSEKGKSQARHRAKTLSDHQFDLVIVSAAIRTKQTAEIIQKELKLHPPTEEIVELYIAPDRPNHTAEEISEIILARISKHKAQDVLVIGHAGIINSIGHLQQPSAIDLLSAHFSPTEGFVIWKDGNLQLIQN